MAFALRFGPYIAIMLLIGAILWLRGDLVGAKADRKAAIVERNQYKAANEANTKIIQGFSARQVDNDAIAAAVANRLAANSQKTETVRQRIRSAANEPGVRDWASMPVPSSVQRALTPSN